jgi:DNA polymerase-3 subunit chi
VARVDFYVLDRVDEHARYMLACRLAEKAYRLKNTVYIHTPNQADAERLDQLLWTFRDGSFVPHDFAADGVTTAITIGCEMDAVTPRDLLINLCDDIPTFAETFPRIAELVTRDEDCRLKGRKRFADYRDHGNEINTHNI